MSEMRTVRFDHLVGVYAVGSGDWSWRDEYEKLIDRPVTQKLMDSIRVEGIREPVLLGNDGRVWDGHHRIIAAMHLGLDQIPVEFSGSVVTEEPEWEYACRNDDTGSVTSVGAPWMDLEYAQRVSANEYPFMVGVRRRKAGPWVPVEQGDDVDG